MFRILSLGGGGGRARVHGLGAGRAGRGHGLRGGRSLRPHHRHIDRRHHCHRPGAGLPARTICDFYEREGRRSFRAPAWVQRVEGRLRQLFGPKHSYEVLRAALIRSWASAFR